MSGRYEARDARRLGVPVVEIRWVPAGEPPMLVLVLAPERLPLLAEALNGYLADAG